MRRPGLIRTGLRKSGLLLFILLFTGYSHAADNIYFGAGLGLNSLRGINFGDGIGFQAFGGYVLPTKVGKGTLAAEVGYMDTGDMDWGLFAATPVRIKGLWVNGVVSLPLKNNLNFIGRAGLNFGDADNNVWILDDDGFMIGGGVGFKINNNSEIRAEYVIRPIVDSLQFNYVMRM